MKKVISTLLIATVTLSLHSCIGCGNNNSSHDEYDENYWNSISRERALKDAGMEDAARMERKARQNYMQGGGYTSPNGERQIHFQGSKEQQEQLKKMDELGW